MRWTRFSRKKRAQRLAEISWTQPPSLQIGGALVLPAWTNTQPDWRGEVLPTLRLAGRLAVTNVTVLGATIDSAQAHFTRHQSVSGTVRSRHRPGQNAA